MNIKQKIGAALAASALAIGMGVVFAPPASATGWMYVSGAPGLPVTFQRPDGSRGTIGQGGKAYPVNFVLVLPRQCVRTPSATYCAPWYDTLKIYVPSWGMTVQRIQ